MPHHWKYEAELPAGLQHSIQVQTDSQTADFNLLVLDERGQVLASDRGPEPGARCVIETPRAQKVTFVVELLSGSGSFSLQVATQPLDRSEGRPRRVPPAAAARRPPSSERTMGRSKRPGLLRKRPGLLKKRSTTRSKRPGLLRQRTRPGDSTAPQRPHAAAPTGSRGGTGSSLTNTEANAMLAAHNRWRGRFGVAPLEWSTELSAYAQQWADELESAGMRMQHRSPNDYGENLYWCSGRAASPDEVVDSWGDEVQLYDYDSNNWWPEAGHFSQVVWHNTTKVGGGVARLNGQELWVCNYDPRGNWTGQRPYEQ